MATTKFSWNEILEHLRDNHGEIDIDKLKTALVEATGDEKTAQLVVKSLPEEHIIANNKLANLMQEEDILGAFAMRVSRRNAKKEIKNACVITYEGDDNVVLKSLRPYTEYDRQVHDAIVSLVANGITQMTASTIYRAMTGMTGDDNVSQKSLDLIEDSIHKMMFMHVTVDMTEELLQRHITLEDSSVIKGGKIDTYLLNIGRVEVKYENADGEGIIVGYKLNEEPILYSYSKLTGQVLTLPSSLLDIRDKSGKPVRNTEQRIAIKGYLMRRISVMQGKTPQSYRILLTHLYEMFPNATDRKQLKRIKDYAAVVLEFWQRQQFIKGYKLVNQKNTDYAFDIDP